MKADARFAMIKPADPEVTRQDLFPLRERTEERLRKNLPKIIGTLTRFERNPTQIPHDLKLRYEEKRNLQLVRWQADGVNGRAFALLDVLGELRIRIIRDSTAPLPLAGGPSFDGARELLGLLWGVPPGEAHRVSRSWWEWLGIDGLSDDDRTKVSVFFEEELNSQKRLTKEIFIKAGAPFEEWKKNTVDKLSGAFGWLTKRAAMAAAIRQLDAGDVPQQTKPSAGTTIRSLIHSSTGWQVELELAEDVEKRFVMIGVADKTGRTWSSSSSSQASNLPPIAERVTADNVRHWAEYRAATIKDREAEQLFHTACDKVRPRIAAAIAAIRPDLEDCARHLRFSREVWRSGAGIANYIKRPDEQVPRFTFSFEYGGSEPRLTTALMIVPANGQEPSMQDEPAWHLFGARGIEQIFGKATEAEWEPLSAFHYPPPPSDPRNGRMVLDSIVGRSVAQAGATRVIVPGFFEVQKYANGNYYFYWNSYSAPDEVGAALDLVRGGLPTSEEQAALIAAKAATLRYPDVSLDDWRVFRSELLLAPFSGGNAGPTFASSRSSNLIVTWRVVFRQLPHSLRYLEAMVNANTGDLLDLRAGKTPVE